VSFVVHDFSLPTSNCGTSLPCNYFPKYIYSNLELLFAYYRFFSAAFSWLAIRERLLGYVLFPTNKQNSSQSLSTSRGRELFTAESAGARIFPLLAR
jgi:hypothetical protein